MDDFKDVFISFKSDGRGDKFAKILARALKDMRYSVYFSQEEKHSGRFPDDLARQISNCKDFIMLASPGYLDDLVRPNAAEKSWVFREILLAKDAIGEDRIIRVNVDERIDAYNDKLALNPDLEFIPRKHDITMKATDFEESPLHRLTKWLASEPREESPFRLQSNGNALYDVQEDFRELLHGAEAGDFQAMYEIANMYYYGFADGDGSTGRDYRNAFKWFKKLSETENEHRPYAINMIGHMYYNGAYQRCGQSYEKSYEHHLRAVEMSGIGSGHLAWMESVGLGCDFDFERVESRFKAVGEADSSVKLNLAQFYNDYGLFDEAAKLYQELAYVLPEAAHKLGLMYAKGVLSSPPKPDFHNADRYFRIAMESESCEAQVYHDLADLYFRPVAGFPKDFNRAQEYYTIAADMGVAQAQYKLGYMYMYGHVKRDIGKAIYYHSLAASQGLLASSENLAMLYQEPGYIDYAKAFEHAQIASHAGLSMGAFLYGSFLFFGRGCEPNTDDAYRWLKFSYDHGYTQAKFLLEKIESLDR